MNRSKFTFALVLLALALAAFSLFGDKGLVELRSMREAVSGQTEVNRALREDVRDLKQQVISLQTDPATLEREARKELLLGRPDEVVVLFDRVTENSSQSQSAYVGKSGASASAEEPKCGAQGVCSHE